MNFNTNYIQTYKHNKYQLISILNINNVDTCAYEDRDR